MFLLDEIYCASVHGRTGSVRNSLLDLAVFAGQAVDTIVGWSSPTAHQRWCPRLDATRNQMGPSTQPRCDENVRHAETRGSISHGKALPLGFLTLCEARDALVHGVNRLGGRFLLGFTLFARQAVDTIVEFVEPNCPLVVIPQLDKIWSQKGSLNTAMLRQRSSLAALCREIDVAKRCVGPAPLECQRG